MRIIVVDDYPAWRYFVRSAIEQHAPSSIICEAADGLEAVQKAGDLQPDLVTMDIGLPKLNGIKAAAQIHKKSPHTKILFVSQEKSFELAEAALVAGGLGYVVKSDGKEVLLKAVETIMQGGRYLSPTLDMPQGKSGALTFNVPQSIR